MWGWEQGKGGDESGGKERDGIRGGRMWVGKCDVGGGSGRKRKRIHNGVSVSPRRHAPRVQKFGRPPAPYPEGPLGQKLAIISEIAPRVDFFLVLSQCKRAWLIIPFHHLGLRYGRARDNDKGFLLHKAIKIDALKRPGSGEGFSRLKRVLMERQATLTKY